MLEGGEAVLNVTHCYFCMIWVSVGFVIVGPIEMCAMPISACIGVVCLVVH